MTEYALVLAAVAGGVPLYREIFADVAAKGYEGFELR
jgi:hypothetical protein